MNDTTPTAQNTSPDSRDQRIAELESELAKERAISQALRERVQQLEADLAILKQAAKRQATRLPDGRMWQSRDVRGVKPGRAPLRVVPDPSRSK
jgi:hypothetical protein